MKKYLHYKIDEFVWDELFRQWVLNPTRESDAYWQTWLAEHPDKTDTIQQARRMVQALQVKEPSLSDEEIKYTVQRTVSRIQHNQPHDWQEPVLRIIPLYRQTWFLLVAMLILVMGVSLGIWTIWFGTSFNNDQQTISYDELVRNKTLTEISNRSEKPMPVKLNDGSLIILKTVCLTSTALI